MYLLLPDSLAQKSKLCGVACGPAKPVAKASVWEQFTQFAGGIFDTSSWPPRWHCGTWSDLHGWLYILSDIGIWAAYFAIPVLLLVIIRKRKDVPYHGIFLLAVAFILLCGLSHLMDAIIFWWPAYRLSAVLRFATAVVSMCTVYALYKVLPSIISLRTVSDLEEEIEKRRVVEEKLRLNEIALNRALELSTQNNRQLKNFTHILSHNIRNHASNMTLVSSLVDVEALDEDNAELFEKMRNVSRALNDTLDDLSQAIKIKESVIAAEQVDLNDLTNKILDVFRSDLDANGATLTTAYEVKEVHFPHIYLESILLNLVSNSLKYRSPDRKLNIQLRSYIDSRSRTVLECTDNGLGIDLELHRNKIFGLYKTFHDRKDANGVGLFLIKTQVETQGGDIEVESTPGEGTTFRIIF